MAGRAHNLYFTGPQALEVRHEPLPEPGPDQVLVQAEQSLISTGTELICFAGAFSPGTHWDQWVRYPFKPGYSLVGRVLEVGGAARERWRVGDRVAVSAPHHQYVAVDAGRPFPVPDGVSDQEASWFNINIITQNAVRRANIRLGDTVVVVGLGILGQLVCQLVRLAGAGGVVAVDPARERVETARRLGATHGVATTAAGALGEVEDVTGGRRADVVFDVTGVAPVFAECQALVRRFGTLVLLGDSGYPERQRLTSHVIREGLTVVGTHGSHPPNRPSAADRWTKDAMVDYFFQCLLAERLDVASLISDEFSPVDAAEVYAALLAEREQHLGVLFDWTLLA